MTSSESEKNRLAEEARYGPLIRTHYLIGFQYFRPPLDGNIASPLPPKFGWVVVEFPRAAPNLMIMFNAAEASLLKTMQEEEKKTYSPAYLCITLMVKIDNPTQFSAEFNRDTSAVQMITTRLADLKTTK